MLEIFAVKLVDKEIFQEIKYHLISKLPAIVAARYNDYKHSDSLQRSLLGELLLRKIISHKIHIPAKEILFQTGEKGKPYLSDHPFFFNISHSGLWVVGAFADREVGVDVELIRPPNYDVAKRFFSEIEIAVLNAFREEDVKMDYFFQLWTLKESYLKAIGTGLTKSLSSFTVTTSGGQIMLVDDALIDHIFFKQYAFDKEYKLAVCSFENEFCEEIQILDINSL